MATLDWHLGTVGDVTLVHLVVRADATERVRIENRIDGPVWPPNDRGRPAPGWDEDGYTGIVEADARLVLGYASPGAPVEPPATLRESGDQPGHAPTATLRELGERSEGAENGEEDDREPSATGSGETRQETAGVPSSVATWLDEVEGRVERAEDLDDAATVSEAAAAVEAAGGHESVRALDRRVGADREALAAADQRLKSLRTRVQSVDIPVDSLGYLE